MSDTVQCVTVYVSLSAPAAAAPQSVPLAESAVQ